MIGEINCTWSFLPNFQMPAFKWSTKTAIWVVQLSVEEGHLIFQQKILSVTQQQPLKSTIHEHYIKEQGMYFIILLEY